MKKINQLLILFTFLFPAFVSAQVYTAPTVGVQSTYNGACLVSTCSGTYYDNGGAGGNYAANVNNIYRTFCPNTAGMCLRATFTSFSMNDTYFLCFGPSSCCDYLSILNGPAQNSTALYSNCTSSPGTITSTDPSGCLTFRFVSDGSVQLAGWACTFSCMACGGGPSGTTNADCAFATAICNDQTFTDAANGPGIVAEGCSGCNTSEVYTNWYRITILTSGTLEFTINPNVNSDDFDPVLYGPNVTCGSLGSPIRCSYAASAGSGNTGLGNGAVDASEDVAGDQWVSPLNVTAGQTYYVLINGWSASSGSNGFLFDWTGTAGLSCAILPAEIVNFSGQYLPEQNTTELFFQTDMERDMKNFSIERHSAGADWKNIHDFAPNGTQSAYLFYDPKPMPGHNQYRVKMTDINGEVFYSDEIEVEVAVQELFYLFPNPAGSVINIEAGSQEGFEGKLELLNPLGQVIQSVPLNIQRGQTIQESFDISALATGVYYVKIGNWIQRFSKN
jgi:Secretion system C-terminal sorting domain